MSDDVALAGVVCLTVEQMPVPHVESVRRACCFCDAPLWLSKELEEFMEHPRASCLACAEEMKLTTIDQSP